MESCMMGNYHVQFGGQFLLILLYLLSTIYRNSELSTTGGLIYFLLGGAEWHGKLLLYCLQLSNSGDALKLKVPSCIWKDTCGLANNLCMVTILKMGETPIGNRGSKSTVLQDGAVVKEQRVDGSLSDSTRSGIRCTLRYFERYTQVGIPSNHFNLTKNRLYSTKTQLTNDCSLDLTDTKLNAVASIDPWALTGFIDGEGSFIISIIKNNNKVGWQVKLEFWLSLPRLLSLFKGTMVQLGCVIFMLFIFVIIEGISVAEILAQENMIYCSMGMVFPVVTYSNADTQKLEILRDNYNKSGIYLIPGGDTS